MFIVTTFIGIGCMRNNAHRSNNENDLHSCIFFYKYISLISQHDHRTIVTLMLWQSWDSFQKESNPCLNIACMLE